MDPWNKDPLYEMFYVTVPQSQRVTNMIICYNTGIIVATRVMIVGSIFCRCDLTAILLVPDHLSWLRLFVSVCILYAINNCVKRSVMFGVNFVSGEWSTSIGDCFSCYAVHLPHILYLDISVWVVDYCSWVATIIFLIPPGKITYVNTIFTLISISFALSSASSLITLTVASYALKLDNPASSSSSSISFYLPSLSIPSWWCMGLWENSWYNCW